MNQYKKIFKENDPFAIIHDIVVLNPEDDNYYGRRSLAYLFNDQPDLAAIDQDMCDELRNIQAVCINIIAVKLV